MMHNEDNWPVDEYVVEEIDPYDDGGFFVKSTDGWSFGVTKEEAEAVGVLPKPGDKIVLLGGLGHQIRGIFIGDHEYRYKTRAQADAEREEWLANYERQKEERFYANIAEWVKRKDALDKSFRERLDRFANKGFKEFWKEDGGYELFTVEQANALYNTAPEDNRVEWLDRFAAASYDEQKELFPGMDDGHSGNTFGGMVGLAKAVANGMEI